VGCFEGAIEYHLLRHRVKEVQGIDVNVAAVDRASAWARENSVSQAPAARCQFQVAEAEQMPFGDNTFDKAVCLDVFEHVAHEQRVAAEIQRVLKPGGTLVLSVPHDFLNFLDPDELTREARNFVRTHIRPKPLLDHPKHRHYDERSLREFFAGFDIDVVHKCGTPVFWVLAMAYTGVGLPSWAVRPLSRLTAGLENWDYRTRLPTGFNIMIRARKRG
jgi:SAM-dependent methyltransferase